jgi:hypothetical protein
LRLNVASVFGEVLFKMERALLQNFAAKQLFDRTENLLLNQMNE